MAATGIRLWVYYPFRAFVNFSVMNDFLHNQSSWNPQILSIDVKLSCLLRCIFHLFCGGLQSQSDNIGAAPMRRWLINFDPESHFDHHLSLIQCRNTVFSSFILRSAFPYPNFWEGFPKIITLRIFIKKK